MPKCLFALLGVLLIVCSRCPMVTAQAPAQQTQDQPKNQGTVYVLRDKKGIEGLGAKPRIFRDDELISLLHNGRYLKMELTPGKHLLTTGTNGVQVDVQPGQVYWYQVVFHNGFTMGYKPPFEIRAINAEEGARLLSKLTMQQPDKKY